MSSNKNSLANLKQAKAAADKKAAAEKETRSKMRSAISTKMEANTILTFKSLISGAFYRGHMIEATQRNDRGYGKEWIVQLSYADEDESVDTSINRYYAPQKLDKTAIANCPADHYWYVTSEPKETQGGKLWYKCTVITAQKDGIVDEVVHEPAKPEDIIRE